MWECVFLFKRSQLNVYIELNGQLRLDSRVNQHYNFYFHYCKHVLKIKVDTLLYPKAQLKEVKLGTTFSIVEENVDEIIVVKLQKKVNMSNSFRLCQQLMNNISCRNLVLVETTNNNDISVVSNWNKQ